MGNKPGNQKIDRLERPITPARRKAFLEHLARTGIVTQAARLASPHSDHIDGCASSFYGLKRRDGKFAAEWEAAMRTADDALMAEAHRRAVEGVERRQFFKGVRITETDPETGKEVPVSEREYSDRLLELMLKARLPRLFHERISVQHSDAPSGWRITAEDLHTLSEKQAAQLAQIMDTVRTARGEVVPDEALDGRAPIDITPTEDDADEPEDFDTGLAQLERMK